MSLHIIPRPQDLTLLEGPAAVLSSAKILELAAAVRPEAPAAADRLAAFANEAAQGGSESAVEANPTLDFVLDDSLAPESFELVVTEGGVSIKAASAAGALYAANALIQAQRTPNAPAFSASSTPRYPNRGFMLDIARHFFGVKEIKQVIDIASTYNLNRLHLHLSDDQGWRIEIDGRPELTKLASANDADGGPGGFLNFDDYEEIQVYAALHGMTVIPEIDLPGHTNALLVAFPEASPDGKPREPYAGIEVGFSWVHLTSDDTWAILDDIVASLARRTHGEYLHLGGDEVLKVERPEYEEFMTRLGKLVTKHGKKMVAWHEVAGSELQDDTQVQFWTANFNLEKLATIADNPNVQVIASPAPHVYLDLKPVEDFPLGLTWAGLVPLKATFEWEPSEAVPVPAEMITGVESCLWTETIRTMDDITTMMLPRIAGVASVAWGSPRDFEEFAQALPTHARDWAAREVAFYRDPAVNWD